MDKEELFVLLSKESVKFGEFTLRSGRKSDFYIDCRPVILSGIGRRMIARTIVGLAKLPLDCFVATGVGGTYMACSIANYFCKSVIHIRGQAKSHGTKNLVELPYDFDPAWNIIIVDDVLTTGSSCKACIEPLLDRKLNIGCCLVLVDREEGGREHIENTYKIPVRSLFTRSDFKKNCQ